MRPGALARLRTLSHSFSQSFSFYDLYGCFPTQDSGNVSRELGQILMNRWSLEALHDFEFGLFKVETLEA